MSGFTVGCLLPTLGSQFSYKFSKQDILHYQVSIRSACRLCFTVGQAASSLCYIKPAVSWHAHRHESCIDCPQTFPQTEKTKRMAEEIHVETLG